MKEHNPLNEQIALSIKDKMYGLPLKEWKDETYDTKKGRFIEIENSLMNQIADLGDDKLMHTFLRWQEIRNELNKMYVESIETVLSDSKINTDL